MDQEVEDFLSHYGVKGMRWGVRKESFFFNNVSAKKFASSDIGKLSLAAARGQHIRTDSPGNYTTFINNRQTRSSPKVVAGVVKAAMQGKKIVTRDGVYEIIVNR